MKRFARILAFLSPILFSVPAVAAMPRYSFSIVETLDGLIFAGVRVPLVISARSEVVPLRVGTVAIVGQKVEIDVLIPESAARAPVVESFLVADLPPLEVGQWRIQVFAKSGDFRELAAELELGVYEGARLRYAGSGEPTEGEPIVLLLNYGPEGMPRVVFGDKRIRIFSGYLSDLPIPGEGYPIPLGALTAGRWRIDLEAATEGIHYQLDLEVKPRPILPGPILLAGEFEVVVTWRNAAGESGEGKLVQPPSRDSALLYFFSPTNWELMVKVLDGCAINGHYWVFAAASTDVGYSIDIRRRGTPQTFLVSHEPGVAAPAITNILAFPCL